MQRGSVIKALKITHRQLGLFFAPAIVFFAFSGALQVFGWHESKRGSDYVPARWIVAIAQLHKKQTLAVPLPKPKDQTPRPAGDRSSTVPKEGRPQGSKFMLQCFVFIMSTALVATTLLGIVMAFFYGGDRRIACGVLILGCLFPVAIVFL